jgi:hypothetical protein
MPLLDEIVSQAPRSVRSALWVLSAVIGFAALGAFGLSAIETKANAAADARAVPIVERVTKLESGQGQLWNVVNSKLDKISSDVAQTKQDIAVLSQRVSDKEKK